MLVRDAMSSVVLTIGPDHTLRQAARLMSARRVGAAVVLDPDAGGVGILTERDVLDSVGAGQDPDREKVAAHVTCDVVFADSGWTLEEAAAAMLRGGFRHLVVLDAGSASGIVSVRDIIRCWTPLRAAPGTAVPGAAGTEADCAPGTVDVRGTAAASP
ncbi:cyclic nucleotide-binding/CBS domain-containing protein [Streptomyces sp. NPDC059506]|uniref:CBS domain-containing protein n=1 Tax=Streptomyces TaxID=1883 RepID=UPI0036AC5306